MMEKAFLSILLCLVSLISLGQEKLVFDGQVSLISSFSPDNTLNCFVGARYIPQLSYKFPIDSLKSDFKAIDFEASVNLSTTTLFHPFDTAQNTQQISPYRLWARYTTERLELRLGLQKIDFGSATLLRPLQWFNQVDPRDPLQLTNGVYGLLGRYYFPNNANLWLWVLYGNEKTRGFDLVESNQNIPEWGGRFQYPTPKGEIALSYHHRQANSTDLGFVTPYEKIPESRIGIDGKWDLKVGLWMEASFSFKSKSIENFTNQSLINIGADYTFGWGNGLNVIAEHLLLSYDRQAFEFENPAHLSALTMSYPIGFFDDLSAIFYYSWAAEDLTVFLNYQHQFKWFTSYVMLYYNPSNQANFQQNELVNNFSGPGIRLMLLYNH